MKNALTVLVSVLLLTCFANAALAQSEDPAAVVDDLKLQLIDLNAEQEMLKLQVAQLDEALKPENIEHSLAGVGSTRPEELREQRRRQLAAETTATVSRLEQVTMKRTQLESALAVAEAKAYEQSARGPSPVDNEFGALGISPFWLMSLVAAGVFALGMLVAGLILLRYMRRERVLR